MTKTRPSRPIPNDVALIDKNGEPGGEVVEDVAAPEDMTFADWCAEAEPWYIDRAARPGEFTAFEAIQDAPARIRNPRNPNWPGLFMPKLHDRGYVDYARDGFGRELFTTSKKPESGGSGVRVWVGVEAMRKVTAA